VEPNKYHAVSCCVHDTYGDAEGEAPWRLIMDGRLMHPRSPSSKNTDLYCKAAFAVAMIPFLFVPVVLLQSSACEKAS